MNEAEAFMSGIAFYDSILYLADLSQLKLNAETLILRACNTGYGKLVSGEGVISMSYGFAQTGVKSILSTQWTTTSAKPLMEAFVSHLRAGYPKDSALYLAKLSLIDTEMPYHWAAYEIQGDMDGIDQITWESNHPYRLWWVLLTSLALVGGLLYGLRRRSNS